MSLVFARSWYSYSEGFLSPADVVTAAKKAMGNESGAKCLAFADKGETAGYFEFIDACREQGVTYLPGIELNLNYAGEIRQVLVYGLRDEGELQLRTMLAASTLAPMDSVAPDVDPALPVIEMKDLHPSLLVLSGQDGSHLMGYRLRHELLSAKDFVTAINKTGARFAMAVDPESVHPRDNRFFNELAGSGVKSIPYRPGIISNISQLSDYMDASSASFPDASVPESFNYEVPEIQSTTSLVRRSKLPGYDPVAVEKLAANAGIKPKTRIAAHGDLSYNGLTPDAALNLLRRRCEDQFAGMKGIDGKAQRDTYSARLDQELSIISKLNFQSRLLIMSDLVSHCKEKHKEAFARGSAANSVVCWMLGISKVDPVLHDLPIERFLNLERPSMPDIDIDIPKSFSPQAFEFMGKILPNSVRIRQPREASIGALIPRIASRLNIRYPDKLGMALRSSLNITEFPKGATIAQMEAIFPDFKEKFMKLREDDQESMDRLYKTLSAVSNRPLGFSAHIGLAACETAVSSKIPVIPTRTADGKWVMTTGVAHSVLEDHGVLKFDLLPRQTLDLLECIQARAVGIKLPSMSDVADRQSPDVFTDVLNRGLVAGVDQIHKHSETLKTIRIKSFSGLENLIALIRPGASGGHQQGDDHTALPPGVSRYLKGENPLKQSIGLLGQKAVQIYEKDTNATRGMVIYDEQFSRLLHNLSDVSVGRCEELRRAKAKGYAPASETVDMVVSGIATKFSASPKIAGEVFDNLSTNGSYLFPKGHAATYTVAALQMMEIKRLAPAAFVAGYIDHFWINAPDIKREAFRVGISSRVRDSRELGVDVTRMDFSKSLLTEVSGNKLRLGLDATTGVSRDEIQRIRANRTVFESEIKSGKLPTPERLSEAPFFLSGETIANAALLGAFVSITDVRASEIARRFSSNDVPFNSPGEAAKSILGFIPDFAHPGHGAPVNTPNRGYRSQTPIPVEDVSLSESDKTPFFVSGFIADGSIFKRRNKNGFSLDFSITGHVGDEPVKVKMWFTLAPKDRVGATEKKLKQLEESATRSFGMLSGHYEKRSLVPITIQVKRDAFKGFSQLIAVNERIEIAVGANEATSTVEKGRDARPAALPPLDRGHPPK